MGNAEDKEETAEGTMNVAKPGPKDVIPNLDLQTICSESNGSTTDISRNVTSMTDDLSPNTCENMDTSETEPIDGPPDLQPYDLYEGPDFSETFDADAFDSIGLNSVMDNDFDNDGRDTPELHLYDTATDEDFEGSNYSFNASGDGSLFNQNEITSEISIEGQSAFSGIKSENEEESQECSMLLEDHTFGEEEKVASSKGEKEEADTDQDRTGDNHIEKEDNQDESFDNSSRKGLDSPSEKRDEMIEDQKEKKPEVEEEEGTSKPKCDITLDTFSAILATRSITHKVLADIASEWISRELKEVDQQSMPEVFQVPTSQSTWQLLSGERIYTREKQKKMMCRRSKRRRIGVSYKDDDPLYNYSGKYEKVKKDRRFTANPWKKTVPGVDDDGKLNCRMCKFVCDTYTAFHQHLLDNHTWKRCTKCDFLTMSQRKMKAHVKIMHTPKDQWPEVKLQKRCHLCGMEVVDAGLLQEHMWYFHKCYICTFTTVHKVDLDRHMDALHKGCPRLHPPESKLQEYMSHAGHVPGVVMPSTKGHSGTTRPPHSQSAAKTHPVTTNMLRKQNMATLQRSSAPATMASARTQTMAPSLGQLKSIGQPSGLAAAHSAGVRGLRQGVTTVPQQVPVSIPPTVVRQQGPADYMETFVRCSFCTYLFSNATAAHAHMANVHWRQLQILAQTGQQVVLQKVVLSTSPPLPRKPHQKVQPNPNTVKHLLNRNDHSYMYNNATVSASIPSRQNVQKDTITIVNPSGPMPLSSLGSPARPITDLTVRHVNPAAQAVSGVVRTPVPGPVSAIPAIRQDFQTVPVSPSPMGVTTNPGTPIIRQQLQPNLATPVPGGLTNVASGAPVGTIQQQILVLKKEGDKFVWVTQSVPNVPSPLTIPNRLPTSVANITTAHQPVSSQSTASTVANQTASVSKPPVNNESQISSTSNQAAERPKQPESLPKHTAVSSRVATSVTTQSATQSPITTTQNITTSPPNVVQLGIVHSVGHATHTPVSTSTIGQSTVSSPSQQGPSHVSTIPVNSPNISSITISPAPVMPNVQVGVSPTGQLALIPQQKTLQPPKTVFYVNKTAHVGNVSAPMQVVNIQGTQTAPRVGSPVVNSGGMQAGVGTSNQPVGATNTILVLPGGQRLVLPNNQKLVAVQGMTPGGTILQPRSLPTVSLAPPVQVSNSQFVMRNTNWKGPGAGSKHLRMPPVQNIGPGQTLLPNSVGGLIVTQSGKDTNVDTSRQGRPPIAPTFYPEPKSGNNDATVVTKAGKLESKPDAGTITSMVKKELPQNKKKSSTKGKGKSLKGKVKSGLSKKAKPSSPVDTEAILRRSFHSNPYLTTKELQQLKIKTYRTSSDIRYWFHNMQRKCMKSFQEREPRVLLRRCDAKRRKVEH